MRVALAAGHSGMPTDERECQFAVIELRVTINSIVTRAAFAAKIGDVLCDKIRSIMAMTGLAFCSIELCHLLVVTIDAREGLSVRQSLVGSEREA